jgi:hypothetical protein
MRPIFNGRKVRLVYAGTCAVALAIPATAAAFTVGPLSTATLGGHAGTVREVAMHTSPRSFVARKSAVPTASQRGCAKLFTVDMGKRAANVIYSQAHPVARHELRLLGYIERCQRNPAAQRFVRGYDHHQAQRRAARLAAARGAVQPSTGGVASSGLASCIIQHESGGNPQATNGQYQGLGQWSPAAWAQDGGTRYAPSPAGASAAQQVAVLNSEGAAGMQQQQGQYDGC